MAWWRRDTYEEMAASLMKLNAELLTESKAKQALFNERVTLEEQRRRIVDIQRFSVVDINTLMGLIVDCINTRKPVPSEEIIRGCFFDLFGVLDAYANDTADVKALLRKHHIANIHSVAEALTADWNHLIAYLREGQKPESRKNFVEPNYGTYSLLKIKVPSLYSRASYDVRYVAGPDCKEYNEKYLLDKKLRELDSAIGLLSDQIELLNEKILPIERDIKEVRPKVDRWHVDKKIA